MAEEPSVVLEKNTTRVRVVADSYAPSGWRLVTLELTFWRAVLAELNTHRLFSRNSESSRAVPTRLRVAQVQNDPFVPLAFSKNRSGMSSTEVLGIEADDEARRAWHLAAVASVASAQLLQEAGAHKQHANRLLEPFQLHTALVSSTHWTNWLAQRDSPNAQPEMQELAALTRQALLESNPVVMRDGDWHMPYVTREERGALPTKTLLAMSAARCARVSYARAGEARTVDQDIQRTDELVRLGHWSPLEHQAQALDALSWRAYASDAAERWIESGVPVGNFAGWRQYRKTFENEHDFQDFSRTEGSL